MLEPQLDLGSAAWAAIKAVPLPSQRDDWHLYIRLETEKVRHAKGELKAFDWRVREEVDRADREDAQRVRNFRTSVGSTDTVISPASRLQIPLNYGPDKRFSTSVAAWSALARTP